MSHVPDLTIGSLLSNGHRTLTNHYGTILGAVLVVLLLYFVAGFITNLIDGALVGEDALIAPMSLITQVLLLGPLGVGTGMLAAMRFRDGSGDLNTVFIGFTRYPQMVLVSLILQLIGLSLTVLSWAMALLGIFAMGPPGMVGAILAILALAVVVIYVMIRVYFAGLVCVDPAGSRPAALDAISYSWRMTSDHTLMLFCASILGALIAIGTLLLLVLPFIFYGLPLLTCATGVAYAMLAARMENSKDCPHCGYPRSDSPVCTECGVPLGPIVV